MGALGTISTRSPISYQLQFNFKFSKCPTPLLFVRSRIVNRRVLCVARNGAKRESDSQLERRHSGSSWADPGLSDWAGDCDQSGDSMQKQGIAGILGVGVASVFLVAGITFVATSIGRSSSLRPKVEMKPLTEQQETFLTSREAVDRDEHKEIDGNRNIQDESADGMYAMPNSVDSQYNLAVSKTGKNVDSNRLITSDAGVELLGRSHQEGTPSATQTDTFESSSTTDFPISVDSQAADGADAKSNATLETQNVARVLMGVGVAVSSKEDAELHKPLQGDRMPVGVSSSKDELSAITYAIVQSSVDKQDTLGKSDVIGDRYVLESESPRNSFTSSGIPAPLLLSAALQVPPEKVLVAAVTDQSQEQALAALQVLKVIKSDAQACELCTRRDYARWLVSASSALSRNSISKVYPAMYIENVTELAFDDITPEDPDFASIQGLAEAGLISSKLSRSDVFSSFEEDMGSFHFYPDSPLSRQDLLTWKMALEKRQLPEADRKMIHQLSGFIDIDKINQDAWPALVADLSAGEQGIVAQAFGYTRLFQPDKPVTKGQAAVALTTGDAADIVNEELARIEADSMAEKAVAAHSALFAEVENAINASFEKELMMEREKIDTVQKMADEAREEVERLRREREEENLALVKERAVIESEMEILNKMRHELEEQLQSVMSDKVEMSYAKERVEKLRKDTEKENIAVCRLQYELEVELKALSMARAWAEDEAKRVQEHAKVLEEARDRWVRQGIKVVIDEDLRKEASADATWPDVRKQLSAEETVERAENLTDQLKVLAGKVEGKSKEVINKIIKTVQLQTSVLREWISTAGKQTMEVRDVAVAKVGGSVQELQQHAVGFSFTVRERAKCVAGDCREGIEKLTQRFKK